MRGRQNILAVLGLFLIACSDGASQAPAGPPGGGRQGGGGPDVVAVVTQPVAQRQLQVDIEAVGTARANESVSVTSKISNTVTAIRFKEGQLVQRGSVLVEFDPAQAQADLAAAQAALIESRANYDRSKALANTQVLSASQVDQIEAVHKANEARVAAAQARLNDTVIRAPFTGRTGLRRVSVGSLVNPGTMITTLDDSSLIKIEFTVPQAHQHVLREGLAVTAQASGLPGRTFEGKVITVDSRVDPVTRAISVLAGIANEDGALKPGTFMSVRMHSTPTAALLIPEAAVVPEQGRMFAFVVENGVALKREIAIGRRRPGEVEIAGGLEQGQRVIVEGAMKVRHEARVREANAAPTPSS
jgi:membrane fusion protein (multidrug efflux system)